MTHTRGWSASRGPTKNMCGRLHGKVTTSLVCCRDRTACRETASTQPSGRELPEFTQRLVDELRDRVGVMSHREEMDHRDTAFTVTFQPF